MIDTATIFFSTLMCLLVVFRAIRLDGQLPWFGKAPGAGTAPGRAPDKARGKAPYGTQSKAADGAHDNAA